MTESEKPDASPSPLLAAAREAAATAPVEPTGDQFPQLPSDVGSGEQTPEFSQTQYPRDAVRGAGIAGLRNLRTLLQALRSPDGKRLRDLVGKIGITIDELPELIAAVNAIRLAEGADAKVKAILDALHVIAKATDFEADDKLVAAIDAIGNSVGGSDALVKIIAAMLGKLGLSSAALASREGGMLAPPDLMDKGEEQVAALAAQVLGDVLTAEHESHLAPVLQPLGLPWPLLLQVVQLVLMFLRNQ